MPKQAKDLFEEITLEVISVFAQCDHPEQFRIIFKEIARKKGVLYKADRRRYNNFFSICQGKFFRRLETNADDWRSWPVKARRYLKIPETPPQAKPLAMLIKQACLF